MHNFNQAKSVILCTILVTVFLSVLPFASGYDFPVPYLATNISAGPYMDGQSIIVSGNLGSDAIWGSGGIIPVTVTITKPDSTTFTLDLTYTLHLSACAEEYTGTFIPDQGGSYTITHVSTELYFQTSFTGYDITDAYCPSATTSNTITVQSFAITRNIASLTIAKGNAATIRVDSTPVGGFSQSVALSISGLPSGVTAGFSPSSITPTASSTLTINVAEFASAGTSTLTITGTYGSLTKQATVSLNVVTPLSSSASPSSSRVHIGQSATFTAAGANGKIPYGFQWYEGSTLLSGYTSSSLTVSKPSTGTFTYYCHVTDDISSSFATNTVSLFVDDFSVSSPVASQMVTKGSAVLYLLNFTTSSGFCNSLSLSASGLPAGATASFNTTSIIPSSSGTIANLTVQTSSSTPVAVSNFTITAVDGAYSHTKQLTINCLAPMSNIMQSSSNVVTVNQNVNLTVNPSGGLAPYSYQWYEGQTPLTGKTASCLIVNKTIGGLYTYFCKITDARQTALGSENVTLTFTDFTINPSSSVISVVRGSSVDCDLTLAGLYGFDDPVVLVVSGLPSGVSSSLGQTIVTPNASTTLTIQTLSSASAGTFDVTVTGASGSLMRTAVIQLTIDAPSYSVIASAGVGGSITPSGTLSVVEGSSIIFTVTANTGYVIADVVDNGVSKGAIATYSLSDIREAHQINATFTPTYVITATAGAGGSISPSGTLVAALGSSYTFTITANNNYQIVDVTDNGVSKGAISSYSLNGVSEAHQINAVFVSTKITLTADSGTVDVTLNAGSNITSLQISGATLSSNQSAAKTILSFNVTGPSGTVGFSNMTILKITIPYGTTPIVYIDGLQAENQGYTEDANNYYVWYSTHFSDHQVQIQFIPPSPTPTPTPTPSPTNSPTTTSSSSSSSSSSSQTSTQATPKPTQKPTPTPTPVPIGSSTSPVIVLSPQISNGTTVGSSSQIGWLTVEGSSLIDHYEVKVDDGVWSNVGMDTSFDCEGLSAGSHVVMIRPVTANGPGVVYTLNLLVESETSLSLYLIIAVVLAIVAVVVLLVFFSRRRARSSSTTQVTPQTPKINDYIFISHVEEDQKVVTKIIDALESAGYATWCYERNNVAGVSYLMQTSQAIEKAKAFMLVISKHSLKSRQMTVEVVHAHETGKQFIPLLLNIDHAEFQAQQPEWSHAIGASTSIQIKNVSEVIPRIIAGLENLGIKKKNQTD